MKESRPGMKIALMGSRGIPGSYSGFETFYEQLAIRLAERGHQVTVYNRKHHFPERYENYRGVKIVTLPAVQSKHLETISHTFLSLLHAVFSGHDVFYMVIVGNSPLILLAHLFRKKIIINVDGADSNREKWQGFAKTYLRWTEKVAARFADVIIADSRVIESRYQSLYQRETVYIPYGANPFPRGNAPAQVLDKFNLKPDEYILFVSRMTPENCADLLITAYRQSGSKKKLVIVGDAPYADEYKNKVRAMAESVPGIVLTGYMFNEDYQQISTNCSYFVLPSGIDGTRPVLLDQMAFGNCVLVRDTPANLEVIDDAGLSFSQYEPVDSLAKGIEELDQNPQTIVEYRDRAMKRVTEIYCWETITSQYEKLFSKTSQ